MKSVRSIVFATMLATFVRPAMAQAPDASGHWEGQVTAPFGEIQFEMDLMRTAGGTWTGTYSQPAQGLKGLPLTSVAAEGRSLRMVLGSGSGESVFSGELLSDGKSIMGEAVAAIGAAPFMMARTGEAHIDPTPRSAGLGQELEGRWDGALDVGGRQLRLALTIAHQPDGTATTSMASIDQGGLPIPVLVTRNAENVTVDVKITGGSYTATLNAERTELSGTFSQGPLSLPLTLRHADR